MNIGNNPNCNTAFHVPTDTGVQVACQADNVGHLSVVDFIQVIDVEQVNLAITFCD